MKISPIGPIAISPVHADLFSHPVTRSHFRSQKNRLLVNLLEQKDRVTISPKAKELSILLQQSRPAPPDRDLQPPIEKPEQPPPIHSPFPQPPPFIPQPPPFENGDGTFIRPGPPAPPVGKPEFPELPPFIPQPPISEPPDEGRGFVRIPEWRWWFDEPPIHDQPPVVAIPEQRNPELPDPMPEETKTLPIGPVPPLQNPEQSISRDQIKSHIIDKDEQ